MNLSFPRCSEPHTLPVNENHRHCLEAGFTMVEIAISLAVIGFALVAIIGVLPMGLQVQKENRQETIINQDATVFMEAIRNGARGVDDLTNYVTAITNYWTRFNISGFTTNKDNSGLDGYTYLKSVVTSVQGVGNNVYPLTNGLNIVGLLSTPKYMYPTNNVNRFYSNYIVASVRALSGSVVEKPPQDNPTILEGAFAYHLFPEVVPVPAWYDTNSPDASYKKNLQANLTELRLTFRWPLLPNGTTGNGKQTFRTQVSGISTNPSGSPLYFFAQPQTCAKAP